jgi:hypothetical protein
VSLLDTRIRHDCAFGKTGSFILFYGKLTASKLVGVRLQKRIIRESHTLLELTVTDHNLPFFGLLLPIFGVFVQKYHQRT